jgi:hypothetical protein
MSPDGAQPVDDRSAGPAGQGAGATGEHAGGPGAGFDRPGEPTEEELRAAYEAELSRLSTADVMAQAVVSLLNLGARRLAPAGGDQGATPGAQPERDLEQARDAIDAVRALLEILERTLPQELAPLRDALSRLQMAYAREVGAGAPAGAAGVPSGTAGAGGAGAPAEPGGASGGGGGPARATNEGAASGPAPRRGEQPKGPGPAESSGRLWVPGR